MTSRERAIAFIIATACGLSLQACMSASERETQSIKEYQQLKESEAYEHSTLEKMNVAFNDFSLCVKAYAESNSRSASPGDVADAAIAKCGPQKSVYISANTSAYLAAEFSTARSLKIPPRVDKAISDANAAASQSTKSLRDAAVMWAIAAVQAAKHP